MVRRNPRCRSCAVAAFAIAAALTHATAWSYSPSPLMKPAGSGTADLLGRSVSAAGDVNGDGYGDVIVGANKGAAGVIAGCA